MIRHPFLKLIITLTCLSASSVWAAREAGRLPLAQRHQLTFYARHEGNFEIYLADADRALVVNLTRHPYEDMRPAWSPDGEQLVFFSTRGTEEQTSGLYLMDIGERQARLLTGSGVSDAYPVWSSDGHTITYSTDRRGGAGIFSVAVADGQVRRLNEYRAALLSYSPDGRRMVFMSACDNNCDLFLMDASGDVHPITNNSVFDVFPVWSPDSRSIAYMSTWNNFFEIYVVDADCAPRSESCEQAARRLTDNRHFDGFPVWSPDGTTLLYSSDRDGDTELYTVDVSCGPLPRDCERAARRLTRLPQRDISPAWSPDGRRIAFISGRDVYVMDADGSNIRLIMSDVLPDQFLVWRP